MRYQYIGEGGYFVGLPACDLNDDELTEDQRRDLKIAVALNLYQPVEAPEKEQAASADQRSDS